MSGESSKHIIIWNDNLFPHNACDDPSGSYSLADYSRLALSANRLSSSPSRFPVDIFFTPKQEGDVNFNLICNVKKKAHPLTLNVKAEGYTMNAEVKCKDRTGLITLLTPKETNNINFYEVGV